MIVVEHLTRRFGRLTAVDDVSFRIEKGEVVGFLGPNGAGKTTTMRMLTGFLPPTSGSVEVAGFDVLHRSLEVRRRIGYLPETVPLYEEHRVEEMLRFQARLHGLGGKAARLRIAAILERVGMAARRRSLIGQLSKGMRQRVGLAVALLPEPEVLILDEPTSGLDPLQRVEVRAIVSRLAKDRTVLISSHILPEIEAVCQRVIVMDGGRIAADGTSDELVASLGGGAHVRLEAVVGQDFEGAIHLIKTLKGVDEVRYRGKLGIHHCFDVESAEDLREDVGALAMQRGWAVRELSWRRPTLEQIFSRIALGGETAPVPAPESAPAEKPAPKKLVYNLNPFERGAKVEPAEPSGKIQFEKGPETEYEKRLKRPKEPPRDLYGRSDGS
ncbi:MAG: ATP-binding cassette domain-containing protein [Planctomycetota bacterium]|nr:ATP-binding cassette domain-containing protein [Planctomycetota bacterium]